jgi:hypothetical protein
MWNSAEIAYPKLRRGPVISVGIATYCTGWELPMASQFSIRKMVKRVQKYASTRHNDCDVAAELEVTLGNNAFVNYNYIVA